MESQVCCLPLCVFQNIYLILINFFGGGYLRLSSLRGDVCEPSSSNVMNSVGSDLSDYICESKGLDLSIVISVVLIVVVHTVGNGTPVVEGGLLTFFPNYSFSIAVLTLVSVELYLQLSVLFSSRI
jgi:hypothetical protein